MEHDHFELAGKVFHSRLIVGTGKYRDFAETAAATPSMTPRSLSTDSFVSAVPTAV